MKSRFSNKMVKNGNDSNDFGKKSVILRKRESIENEKIIAIYYHIPAKIAIFYHLRGIGFFGQDEPNWIFLSSKIASYAFFEHKKLSLELPSSHALLMYLEDNGEGVIKKVMS